MALLEQIARRIFDYVTGYAGKRRVIASYLGMSVLDLGCGQEALVPFLRQGASYVGIDANQKWIERLKSKYPQYSFYCLDLDKDPLPDSVTSVHFSSIVLLAVIEHLENPDFMLSQCQHLMNDNTLLIITTPTATGDLALRAFEKVWGNPKDPNARPHLRSYSKETLQSLGKAHGLVCQLYRRLGWHRQNQLAIYTKASALPLVGKRK